MVEAEAAPPLAASLDEVKAHLRIEGDAEDALIGALIGAAAGLCEQFTGRALIGRAVRETIPASDRWRRLSLTPVSAITGVTGLAAGSVAFALPADAYAIDIDANGEGWVRIARPGSATRAIVAYQAGMAADRDAVPEPLRQGIVRLVAHLFAHRDAADDRGPPAAVAALWRPWRRVRIA